MTLSTTLMIMAMIALVLYLILIIRGVNREKQNKDIQDAIDAMTLDNKSKLKYINKIFRHERYLVNRLGIPEDRIRTFVYAERVLVICVVIASFMLLSYVGIAFCVCAVAYVIMNNQLKDAIEQSGVDRIQDIVAFMDYFSPQIASGSSSKQAFTSYVAQLPDDSKYKPMFIEYLQARQDDDYSYKTPAAIKDITDIYEIALYNEAQGTSNYLYVIEEAKSDLFQKFQYYTQYQADASRVIGPIEKAYCIGVPFITIIVYTSLGEFWHSPWGIVAAILLIVLFIAFKYLCNKLAIDTLDQVL